MKAIYTVGYFLFLFPMLVAGAFVWDAVAVDKMFHCSDSAGPADLIPPFVHSCCGDYYIAPATLVWLLWIVIVGIACTVPVLMILSARGAFRFMLRLTDRLRPAPR